MAVTLDAVTLQPIKTAPQPTPAVAVAPPVVVVAESARGGRRDSQNQRGKEQSLGFRAVLDAAVAGKVTFDAAPVETAKADLPPRPTKLPDSGPAELNGNESSVLLDAAYARRGGNDAKSSAGVRVNLAATSRYAQAFFADGRTYARRGESLELTV